MSASPQPEEARIKHPNPFADFWLSLTHAFEVQPGHVAHIYSSGEDAMLPWETATGRLLLVYTSTRQEAVALHNASLGHADSMGAQYLPEWPWRLLLDALPPATSSNRVEFTFPVKRRSTDAA